MQEQIRKLHLLYCAISRMQVALRYNRESTWLEFIQAGFTEADLEVVLKRLLRLVECGERRPESLKFSNAIEQLDRFEEELALVRAEETGALKVGEGRLSVMDLERIIDAKESACAELMYANASEDAFGLHWTDAGARDNYRRLQSEIRRLKQRIASMA